MHPKHLKITDFSYTLPPERITKQPLEKRDASKLLGYKNGVIVDHFFTDLPNILPPNSLLVFNDSKVVEARLIFEKESGGQIEIFVLSSNKMDVSSAMQTQEKIICNCLVGGAKKWKGETLKLLLGNDLQAETIRLEATLLEKKEDHFLIEFIWKPAQKTFAEILHLLGQIPIPPYFERPSNDADKERYQTVYARANGSVAAPTAGLHFTPQILQEISKKNITTAYTTLHVGAGTFRPVKSAEMQGHLMHSEYMEVDENLILKLIEIKAIIAVGTTSLRTLESLYWMGIKTITNPNISTYNLMLTQWEIYDELIPLQTDKTTALQSLLNWLKHNAIQRLIIQTQILIAPPYSPKIVTGLVTNFHQPQSTLLLLVAALVGDNWKKIYSHALENDYRFLSYGDSSFLEF